MRPVNCPRVVALGPKAWSCFKSCGEAPTMERPGGSRRSPARAHLEHDLRQNDRRDVKRCLMGAPGHAKTIFFDPGGRQEPQKRGNNDCRDPRTPGMKKDPKNGKAENEPEVPDICRYVDVMLRTELNLIAEP